jgi:hypothetical protein
LQRLEGPLRASFDNGQVTSPTAEASVDSGPDASPSVHGQGRRTYDQAFPESSVDVAQPPVASKAHVPGLSRGRDVRSQVDGLATVSVDNDDVVMYGDSSTIAFVRQVASGGEGQRASTQENAR